jgi:hypothetical protein
MTDAADDISDPSRELAEARAAPNEQLALQLHAVQADVARLLAAAPSDEDDQGDELVTIKMAAADVGVPPQTVWRWQAQHPDALGVKRLGSKILLSRRKVRFFARRLRSKF